MNRHGEALYVYDRVCPKKSKHSEIRRTYGRVPPKTNRYSPSAENGERVYGKAFVRSQINRAHEAGFEVFTDRGHSESHESNEAYEAYQYRPGAADGGEAVKAPPFKLMIDRIVDFFESVDDKGRRDEAIARKRAVAWKKFYEYKHIFFTSLVLLIISIAFLLFVYKVFFVVENVDISGSEIYTAEEIMLSSGIEQGDNLYSFAGDEVGDAITFHCPYIKSADIDRTVPKSVAITLEDDAAAYYAMIWDDCVLLSEGLRVLETVDRADISEDDGLVELILPSVKYSVAGRVLEFADTRYERFVRDVLAEIRKSELLANGMIDEVNLSDEYNITVDSCGRYLLVLGSEKDCGIKLRMGYRTIVSEQFDDLLPARINLSGGTRAVVRPDAALDLDE